MQYISDKSSLLQSRGDCRNESESLEHRKSWAIYFIPSPALCAASKSETAVDFKGTGREIKRNKDCSTPAVHDPSKATDFQRIWSPWHLHKIDPSTGFYPVSTR